MKKQDMLSYMSLIDDKYIAEASPENPKYNRRARILRIGAVAACLCVIVGALNLWLFMPKNNRPDDVSMYSDSEYYPIIKKLNKLNYVPFLYSNNFEMISDKLSGFTSKEDFDSVMDDAGGVIEAPAVNESEDVVDVTDNQVEGVSEADLIKRSNKHIFYLSDGELRIYSIEKEDSELVGSYKIDKNNDDYKYFRNHSEFYISSDFKSLILIDSYSGKIGKNFVNIISLDVSDPANVTEKNRVMIEGDYLSSRLTNGSLLLLSRFDVAASPDFSNEAEFIPQIDTGDGLSSIPYDSIISPDTLTNGSYTVISKLDESTLKAEDFLAYLSYSYNVYVSPNSIYLTRPYTDIIEGKNSQSAVSMTEISRISYSEDGLQNMGSISLKGSVRDQYSLDQYEGYLRVVTTTTKSYMSSDSGFNRVDIDVTDGAEFGTNASLYIISLEDLTVVNSVENFAPWGESVQSVRFDGTVLYVCTSVMLSDPVFFFDLSDVNNVTYKDTGRIDGFSSSLINIGGGYLLGIGRADSWSNVKVEVYKEEGTSVVSVDKYVVDNADYSTVYKSYYVDREHSLFGFGVTCYPIDKYDNDIGFYILLHFNGYELIELAKISSQGNDDYKRAVYIDGYLYVLSPCDFEVEKIA